MSTYIYALQRKTKVIVGNVVAHTKFVSKDYCQNIDPRTSAAINRTTDHFQRVGEPDYVVHGEFADGQSVWTYDPMFSCYFDSSLGATYCRAKQVGTLKKVGRSFTIEFSKASA